MMVICLQVVITLVVLAFGAFVYLRPMRMIEFQKKFYLLINWRMEPVSMNKEIRNTKGMGLFLLVMIAVIWIWRLRSLIR